MYIDRKLGQIITNKLNNVPAVALIGPRQCGKSTLAKAVLSPIKNSLYLDLERPSDLNKLNDPEAFFSLNADKLICLDEIQRKPEIFSIRNMKKRLIKSPKLYLRDTGLLHTLLQIVDQNDLLGHPVYGSSWEGFALENILSSSSIWKPYFYRNSNRSEIDLVLEKANKRIAIEFKVSTSPTVSKGFYNALKDIEASEAWIIAPIKEIYPLKKDILAAPLWEIIKYLQRQ